MSELGDEKLLNDENPRLHMIVTGHKKPITSISFEPNSLQFASSSEESSIILWKNVNSTSADTKTVCNYTFNGHTDSVKCLDFSRNGKILASCSKDASVRLWVPTIHGKCTEFKASTSSVNTLCFSSNTTELLTGCNEKAIKMWDVQRKHLILSHLAHNNWVNCAKISPNGDFIASCADDHTVKIWDKQSMKLIHTFVTPQANPRYISIHADNESVAVAMSCGSVRVYDIPNRKLQQHYTLHTQTTCVHWHPSKYYLLSSGTEGKVRVIDIMEGRPIYTIRGDGHSVNSCRFSDNGEFFAIGGVEKSIMLWKSNL